MRNKKKRMRSSAEKQAIQRYYIEKRIKDQNRHNPKPINVGKVYRGETKYIDREPKNGVKPDKERTKEKFGFVSETSEA